MFLKQITRDQIWSKSTMYLASLDIVRILNISENMHFKHYVSEDYTKYKR